MFGKRLAELRKRNGISQDILAEELGVRRNTISMYEQGKREPSLKVLSKVSDYFGVTVDYLLGKNGFWKPPEEFKNINVDYIKMIEDWEKEGHSPESIKKMWEYISELAENYRSK